jgi:polyribonucleotide nucleotidyltransferase
MVNKAKEMIELTLNPPVPEMGMVYEGTVVGTTKFGAFVNILPGRDGLVHISKLGNGQRINNVEDVLNVGDVLQVRVDEMDDRGKVALTPVGDGQDSSAGGSHPERSEGSRDSSSSTQNDKEPRESRSRTRSSSKSDDRDFASFSDFLDEEMKSQFGDLGPEEVRRPRDNNRRGPRRRS